jgi:hypothetical protein
MAVDKVNWGGSPVDEVYVADAKLWPGAAAGLPGLGGWAEVSDPPTSTYTDAGGVKWNVWQFTAAAGDLHITAAGLLDCFLIGGGGGAQNTWPGCGGSVREGLHVFPVGAVHVTVGDGGAANTPNALAHSGKPSSIGSVATGMAAGATPYPLGAGATAAAPNGGVISSITGAAVQYGVADHAVVANTGNGGSGPSNSAGSTGIVIARRPA